MKCYSTVAEIGKKVDLAIFVVPARIVPKAMKAAHNAKTVIIVASGFSETGENRLAAKVKNIALKNKQRVLGPNCLGIQTPRFKLNATFAPELATPGKIAFVSQSGGFAAALLDWAEQEKIGFSGIVSVGNMLDVNFTDLLHYFKNDKATEVIFLYVEGLKDGKSFLKAVKKCKKPVVAFKVGKTKAGKKAAATHTGSIAGEHAIYRGAFKQAGVIEASSTTELFDLIKAFSAVKMPKSKEVIIVTNSGGPGAAAADAISPPLKIHKDHVIDLTGSATAKHFRDTFKSLEKTDASVIAIHVPTAISDSYAVSKEIAKFSKKRTVVNCCLGGRKACRCGTIIKSHYADYFDSPERAVNVLKKLVLASKL